MNALIQGIQYVYYIGVPIAAVILITLIWILIRHAQKKKFRSDRQAANETILLALGGRENIISASSSGSRLVLQLKDYSKLQDDVLKQAGVSSILRMTNKVTLVIGQDAKEIEALFRQ